MFHSSGTRRSIYFIKLNITSTKSRIPNYPWRFSVKQFIPFVSCSQSAFLLKIISLINHIVIFHNHLYIYRKNRCQRYMLMLLHLTLLKWKVTWNHHFGWNLVCFRFGGSGIGVCMKSHDEGSETFNICHVVFIWVYEVGVIEEHTIFAAYDYPSSHCSLWKYIDIFYINFLRYHTNDYQSYETVGMHTHTC